MDTRNDFLLFAILNGTMLIAVCVVYLLLNSPYLTLPGGSVLTLPGGPPLTPPMVAPQDTSLLRTQLANASKQIQDANDTYNQKFRRLFPSGVNRTAVDSIGSVRQVIIPSTIATYQAIEKELASMNTSDSELNNEKTALVSICNYRIKYLEGTNAAYQGLVLELANPTKSKDAYNSAKEPLNDVITIINTTNYPSDYREYVNADKHAAEDLLAWVQGRIFRMPW